MKIAAHIAASLLGFAFVALSLMFLLNFVPQPKIEPDSLTDHFMKAFGPTGWMEMVKVLELTGGILVAIPKTRNFGLLVLGPILLNILAFHIFIEHGADIAIPAVFAALALFLLWFERRAFLGLLH